MAARGGASGTNQAVSFEESPVAHPALGLRAFWPFRPERPKPAVCRNFAIVLVARVGAPVARRVPTCAPETVQNRSTMRVLVVPGRQALT